MSKPEPFIKRNWQIIMAAVGVGIWLLRLEGRVNYVERTQTTEVQGMRDDIKDIRKEIAGMRGDFQKMAENLATMAGYRQAQLEARGKR